jgi:hypothetical protein
VIGLALSARWIVQNGQRPSASPPAPTALAASSVTASAQPNSASGAAAAPHKHLKKGRHHKSRRHSAE